jgi:hypothetical protein
MKKWAWKMEFQSDGWSHWHLLVGRTRRFAEAEMKQIYRFWSLGRASVERVRVDDFLYSFESPDRGRANPSWCTSLRFDR